MADASQARADDEKFAVAFVINVVLAILFLVLFLIFRKRVPRVYEPRCFASKQNKLGEEEDEVEQRLLPPSPPASVFGWVGSTIRYKDETLLQSHGLDAMMFVKFLKMMVFIIGLQAIYGVVVLFPVNSTGENTVLRPGESNELFVEGLSRLSLSGVGIGSVRMVAHIISVVFNSVVVYFFSYRMYREYMRQRIHMKTNTSKKENYVVMVREIPTSLKTDEALREYFEKLYPGKVAGVVRARTTPELEKKLQQRDAHMRNLEKATCVFQKTGTRPTNKDKLFRGNVVDSMEWFGNKLDKKTVTVHLLQEKEWPITGVAFVIFNDQPTALQCSQTILHAENKYMPAAAPEPNDILWSKLGIGHNNRMVRSLIVNVFIFFLVFFWTIPVTFVSGLSNLATIAQIPGFGFLVGVLALSPVVKGFLQGFLPTLALIIFFALLVLIITTAASAQGLYTKSRLSRSVMSKYFVFQVFNIFLIYSIAGSVFGVIEDIVNNPTSVINLLATSLPKQYVFFVNYIMILSLSGHTMGLWRPGPLIVRWIKQKWLCKSPKDFRDAENPGFFKYELAYATHLLVLLIVLTYSTLAPFILIWATLYYMMAYLSQKYNIVYVFNKDYESGGLHWPLVFNRICVGLLIYQLVLVGEFSIYKFTAGIVVSAICVAATLLFWKYTLDQFAKSAEFGALDAFANPQAYKKNAAEVKLEVKEFTTETKNNEVVEAYAQPSLVTVLPQPEYWDGEVPNNNGESSKRPLNDTKELLSDDEEKGKAKQQEDEEIRQSR